MTDLAQICDDALAARAAGEPDKAAECWRIALDHSPDDWAIGLELKHDLRDGKHYPDSDARFRRAARSLPDEAWVEHFAFFYTYHGSELDAIDQRARALLGRWPDDSRLQVILGDVAAQRQAWGEAERAYTDALLLDPRHGRCRGNLALAQLYARLSDTAWPNTGETYSVFVINLDRTIDRMSEIHRRFAGSPIPLRRLAATQGDRVPAAAAARLTGQKAHQSGTLGCFLSHVDAWEKFLASKEDCALVIEDDVIPQMMLPPRLGGLALPDGWDVVWVNDRMAPQLQIGAETGFTVHPLAPVIQAFWAETVAPGADGYLISRSGARCLLDWVVEDGMADDVDWRMVAYGLSPEDIAGIPAAVYAYGELARLALSNTRAARLRAYVLHPPLIRDVGLFSERENLNRGATEAAPG